MTKYYGIGLGRTGTKSLWEAFQQMGFKSRHYMMSFNLKFIAQYDFINDAPIPFNFKRLDKEFLDSKFIYTIRDIEPWLKSIEKHITKKNTRFIRKRIKLQRIEMYGAYRFERNTFIDAYKKHDKQIREHFKDRPNDLLIMDICNGDGWEKLIPFIGKENIINKGFDCSTSLFPRLNKGVKS